MSSQAEDSKWASGSRSSPAIADERFEPKGRISGTSIDVADLAARPRGAGAPAVVPQYAAKDVTASGLPAAQGEPRVPAELQSDEAREELAVSAASAREAIRAQLRYRDDGSVQYEDVIFANEASALEVLAASTNGSRDKSLYLSTRLWPRPGLVLETPVSVCFHSGSNTSSQDRAYVQTLVEETWEAVADINFVGWAACTGGENISIKHLIGTGGGGSSWIGTEALSMSAPTMIINTHPANQAYEDYTILHEFGHAMGMMHEHWRSEYTTGWCAASDSAIAGGDYPYNGDTYATVGSFDAQSVMYYCDSSYGDLSASDIATAQEMYGPSDWPYVVRFTPWGANPSVSAVVSNLDTGSNNSFSSALGQTVTGSNPELFRMGDDWTASATPPNATWRCTNDSGVVPAGGFGQAGKEMRVVCYRPVEVVAVLGSV